MQINAKTKTGEHVHLVLCPKCAGTGNTAHGIITDCHHCHGVGLMWETD